MVDQSAIGTVQPPYDMVVERGKIREFARATMTRNPDYLEDPTPVSEPTFLITSAFWFDPKASNPIGSLGIDLARVLHGGPEFVFHGPPPVAGTTLTAEGRIDKVYEKEGRRGGTMTFVETVTDYRDQQGNVVAAARNTLIVTGKAPEKEG
jgi:hypothetical protein